MSQIWNSVQAEIVAALAALIPVAGMALRSWLQHRTRRWNEAGLEAWRRAEERAPAGAPEAMLEQLATRALQERGLSPEKAVALARRTRPEPIPVMVDLGRPAMLPPEPAPSSAERTTVPSISVKPPTG